MDAAAECEVHEFDALLAEALPPSPVAAAHEADDRSSSSSSSEEEEPAPTVRIEGVDVDGKPVEAEFTTIAAALDRLADGIVEVFAEHREVVSETLVIKGGVVLHADAARCEIIGGFHAAAVLRLVPVPGREPPVIRNLQAGRSRAADASKPVVELREGEAFVQDCSLDGGKVTLLASRGSRAHVAGCTMKNGGCGVVLHDAFCRISDNRIENMRLSAISIFGDLGAECALVEENVLEDSKVAVSLQMRCDGVTDAAVAPLLASNRFIDNEVDVAASIAGPFGALPLSSWPPSPFVHAAKRWTVHVDEKRIRVAKVEGRKRGPQSGSVNEDPDGQYTQEASSRSSKKRKFRSVKDSYGMLGVDRGASHAEIAAAFRRKALDVHPDKCDDSGAAEQFVALKAARDRLLKTAGAREQVRHSEWKPRDAKQKPRAQQNWTEPSYEDWGAWNGDWSAGDWEGQSWAEEAAWGGADDPQPSQTEGDGQPDQQPWSDDHTTWSSSWEDHQSWQSQPEHQHDAWPTDSRTAAESVHPEPVLPDTMPQDQSGEAPHEEVKS